MRRGCRVLTSRWFVLCIDDCRFHDPIEAAKLRKEREEYMASHPNEAVTAPSVIDWSYATQELEAMNNPGGGEGTGAVTPLSTAQTDEGDLASPRDKHHHRVHNQEGDEGGGVIGDEDESEEDEEEDEDDDFIPLEGLDGWESLASYHCCS